MNFFHAQMIGGETKIDGDAHVFLGEKSGTFVEWSWTNNILTLKNDRYGYYPVYYFCDERHLIISPSIEKIIERVPGINFDEQGFSVFLRQGALIGDETVFENVRALPPNSVLTWQAGKISVDRNEYKPPKTLTIERGAAMEIYAELFQKAIEKNLPAEGKKIALPLSGGRDSRHILFALAKAGRQPDVCLTTLHPPPRANEDARIAAMVCEAVNVKHVLVRQFDSRFETEKKKNELTGYTVTEHGWYLPMAEMVNDGYDVIYDGIAGDVLSAGHFLDDELHALYRQNDFGELANRLLLPEGYIAKLLTAENYQKFSRHKALTQMLKEIPRYAEHQNPVGAFYLWNRTRRCVSISPYSLLKDSVTVKMPFLDQELFDFLYSLPAEMFLDHTFHTDTIAFAYPEFSNIPYEVKSAKKVRDLKNFKRFSREIMRYAMTPRKRKLIDRKFLLSRCLRCLVDNNYSQTIWEFGDLAVLLLQLERL